jgi:hypothetical protein
MATPGDERYRYQPRVCSLRGCEVWAITTQQSDGTWRPVNCLDKEELCFAMGCAFTTDGGGWPFPPLPTPPPVSSAA